jgi:outer membrane lipoprotein-sorting protein
MGFCLPVGAQTVDEILNKNAQAHGGLEKIKSISTMRITGKISAASAPEVGFTIQKKRPNLLRIDLTDRGKKAVQAYDGSTGWETSLLGGAPLQATEDELKEIRDDTDFDGPLIDFRDKAEAVELVGKEDINGTAAYKLKVTLNDGSTEYFYLDAGNGLELKQTRKTKQAGKEVDVEFFFSNYKQVKGLTLPFSTKVKTSGKPDQQIAIENVEINPAIDDSIFRMPSAAVSESST